MERKYRTRTAVLNSTGDLVMTFITEQFPGAPELDTEVKIEGGILCWISLPEKEAFMQELNAVIEKYRI